jgi:hypothetical protein
VYLRTTGLLLKCLKIISIFNLFAQKKREVSPRAMRIMESLTKTELEQYDSVVAWMESEVLTLLTAVVTAEAMEEKKLGSIMQVR